MSVILPDRDLIEAIAADLGVDASFVEKDWHAMLMAGVVADVVCAGLRAVFSGGTSLSKGYGLIKRFSEDLDFKVALPREETKLSERRAFRYAIVEALRTSGNGWTLSDEDVQALNESRFFRCQITYQNDYTPTSALRPHIKLEVTIASPALPCERRPLQSFVAQALRKPPEVPAMFCVSPVETAADKLSALTWRVLVRDRGSTQDDPTLVRHLYDLAALEDLATQSPTFVPLMRQTLEKDAGRWHLPSEIAEMTIQEQLLAALREISTDPEYAAEYKEFVLGMCYAPEGEIPSFEAALEAAARLAAVI